MKLTLGKGVNVELAYNRRTAEVIISMETPRHVTIKMTLPNENAVQFGDAITECAKVARLAQEEL